MIDRLLKAWSKASDVSPRDVAFSLRGASANACLRDKKESVELVERSFVLKFFSSKRKVGLLHLSVQSAGK